MSDIRGGPQPCTFSVGFVGYSKNPNTVHAYTRYALLVLHAESIIFLSMFGAVPVAAVLRVANSYQDSDV